ncbi:Uma2 family endonuclease [Allokutzneria sp. NRRL B-24872]|uniref:Uma2 family endonuclease n=1 Tax=Allokutzneria sp. NRRL B-24872 TaxID=1137961 RepID=UPI000A3C2ACF|nr:Uma2 family endonuclease [Allokutzneria sp. NRRL B-24872]
MEFSRPDHLLTIDEYVALGETEHGYTELQEGCLLMSPSPTPEHSFALNRLLRALDDRVPKTYSVFPELDVDLELAAPGKPGFSRRPGVLVAERAGRARVRAEGGLIRASEVLLVVEIVSPGSRRMDNVVKRQEYADAGIPHYWIVDLDEPVSLIAYSLTEEFGYVDSQEVSKRFTAAEPFPVDIDLDRLLEEDD